MDVSRQEDDEGAQGYEADAGAEAGKEDVQEDGGWCCRDRLSSEGWQEDSQDQEVSQGWPQALKRNSIHQE